MAGQLTIDTLKASSGVLATQNGMTGIAKAWALIDGTSGAVTSSFNISSTTRTATGVYTINFTTSLTSANYVVVAGGNSITGTSYPAAANRSGSVLGTTSSFSLEVAASTGTGYTSRDCTYVSVAIFGA